MSKIQTWLDVQDQLTGQRTALNEEIAAYPGPITGCDAQFNHLLELRTLLNAEISRLGIAKKEDPNRLKNFMESCQFLGGTDGEKQQ